VDHSYCYTERGSASGFPRLYLPACTIASCDILHDRKRYHRVGRNWLWKDGSILSTNIAGSARTAERREMVCPHSDPNQASHSSFIILVGEFGVCHRELAFQIDEQVKALGGGIGVRSVAVVGGIDMMTQAHTLFKKPPPHVVVGKYWVGGGAKGCRGCSHLHV
jgi:hypothetical protein